ncbi:hypothetical protein [Actinomyces minihominis]|uniref:hypothetical protein n=1 Tax=Actinomyces minihominis TaxID=2002838 RepID=UPI000C06BAEE|nr:hypothetical protein [Actinomyces minihominis]
MRSFEQPAPDPQPPALPWLEWTAGQRVVVRYVDEDGSTRDALGTLVETEPDHVVIDARRGRVRVEATQMIIGRIVKPPRPWGAPPHLG